MNSPMPMPSASDWSNPTNSIAGYPHLWRRSNEPRRPMVLRSFIVSRGPAFRTDESVPACRCLEPLAAESASYFKSLVFAIDAVPVRQQHSGDKVEGHTQARAAE